MITLQSLMSSDLKILSANIKKNILAKRNKFTVTNTVDIKEIVKEHKYVSGLHSKQFIIVIINFILIIRLCGVGRNDGKYYILL